MTRSDLRWRVWTGLAALLVLGPIWSVHREVWDGVIGAYGLERHNDQALRGWLLPGNWGLVYVMLRAIGWLSDTLSIAPWIWIKLVISASVVGIAIEARRLCQDCLRWDEESSRAAGLLALVFPCWYLLYGTTFIYIVFIWWVFLGHRWMHSGSRARQVAGYLLLLLSFQVNSNFVMVFALEGARWLCRDRTRPWSWGRTALVALSAIAIYLALRLVLTPRGAYQGYNNLILPFSAEGLIAWVRSGLMFATWLPLIVAPAGAAWVLSRGAKSASETMDGRGAAAVAMLFGGALFAYMAVGKGAPLFVLSLPLKWLGTSSFLGRETDQWFFTTVDGWSTRHAFLFSVPAAIATVGLVRWVVERGNAVTAQRSCLWAIALAVLLDLGWMAYGHAAKLTRLGQEQAIIEGLRTLPPPLPGRVDLRLSPRPPWSVWTYEANYWMWQAYRQSIWATAAYPRPDKPGVSAATEPALKDREAAVAAEQLRDYNVMSQFERQACRTVLQVRIPEAIGPLTLPAASWGMGSMPAAAVEETSRICS